MSAMDNQSWKNGQRGIFTLLMVIFFIWILAGGRLPFRSAGQDVKTTVRDAGQDLKSTGRDAADSIRHAIQ